MWEISSNFYHRRCNPMYNKDILLFSWFKRKKALHPIQSQSSYLLSKFQFFLPSLNLGWLICLSSLAQLFLTSITSAFKNAHLASSCKMYKIKQRHISFEPLIQLIFYLHSILTDRCCLHFSPFCIPFLVSSSLYSGFFHKSTETAFTVFFAPKFNQ